MAVKNITLKSVSDRVASQQYSCTTMIITLFGDVVSQHGGWIWLGSLINAMTPMGYSERLVRTAVFRLVQQEWLQVSKIGRRSYYCLTDSTKGQHDKADRRIYAAGHGAWDGVWTLVSMLRVEDEKRELLRKSLMWQGYSTLVPGMLARPSSDRTSLKETLDELAVANQVLVLSATSEDASSATLLRELAHERWGLDEVEVLYREFLDVYRPLVKQLDGKQVEPQVAFLLRNILIHDYRRILLCDPDFPEKMLPSGWVGHEAQQLTRRLYRALVNPSLQYIEAELENAQGALPEASASFARRFGGLVN